MTLALGGIIEKILLIIVFGEKWQLIIMRAENDLESVIADMEGFTFGCELRAFYIEDDIKDLLTWTIGRSFGNSANKICINHDWSFVGESTYSIGEPEYVGTMPIRKELTMII